MAKTLAGGKIPQLQSAVMGARKDAATISQRRRRVNARGVPFEIRRVLPVAKSYSRSVWSEIPKRAAVAVG
jgi:hypothetical protein